MTTTPSSNRKRALVPFQVQNFPLPLKRAILKEALRRKASMNDVAVEALAEHFGSKFTPSGRVPYVRGTDGSDMVCLQMPSALRKKIRVKAASQGLTRREVVVQLLSESFLGNKA